MNAFHSLFGGVRPLVGMIHLAPLPGSPVGGDLAAALRRAHEDARCLVDAGFDGLIVENFGDAPFAKARVPAATVAAMAVVCHEIRAAHNVPLGVNVLRNDAESALSIATVVGADFIRVNVHIGAVVADQGILEGAARETLLLRKMLGSSVLLFADVRVKHSRPLGEPSENPAADFVAEAKDAALRGLADALILSGVSTGSPANPAEFSMLRAKLPGVPLVVGSGVTEKNVEEYWPVCDGIILGTAVKEDGDPRRPVENEKARAMAGRVLDLRRKKTGPSNTLS